MNQSYRLKQELIENYRIICANAPQEIENWLTLGRYLIDIEAYEEAEKALTKLFESGKFFNFKDGVPRLRFRSLFRFKKNRLLFARAYTDLAMIALNQGNLAQSERLLLMALKVFEKTNEDFEYARASNRLGMVYRLVGAFESAEEAHYRAKDIAKNKEWRSVLAETLANLGMVYEGKERFIQALECHQEALELYVQEEEEFFEKDVSFEKGCVLRQIGLCTLRQGFAKDSILYFEKALCLFEGLDDLLFQSRILRDISLSFQALSELDNAILFSTRALTQAERSQDGYEIASSRLRLAVLKMEHFVSDEQIESLLLNAIDFFKKEKKIQEQANAYASLGLFYLRAGSLDKAESFFKDSLRLEQRLNRSLGMASDYSNLGLIAQKKSEPQKAFEYWQKASDFFENSGDFKSSEVFKAKAQQMKDSFFKKAP